MEEFRGYVEHIIFRSEETGYTVFELNSEENRITCTGHPAAISEGESCRVTGTFVTHAVYGEQLKIESYEAVMPETAEAVLRYLSSGAIKGIGAALAARIVAYREEHGGFQYLYELTNVKGIGISTFEALQELITLDTEE